MHNQRSRPRRVYLTSKRAHHETMEALAHLHRHQLQILERMENIMSVADDIKAALADVAAETTAETDLVTAIDIKITGLGDQITALQQQIADLTAAGGGGLSAADVSDIQASIAAIKTGTDAVKAKLEITAGTSAAP